MISLHTSFWLSNPEPPKLSSLGWQIRVPRLIDFLCTVRRPPHLWKRSSPSEIFMVSTIWFYGERCLYDPMNGRCTMAHPHKCLRIHLLCPTRGWVFVRVDTRKSAKSRYLFIRTASVINIFFLHILLYSTLPIPLPASDYSHQVMSCNVDLTIHQDTPLKPTSDFQL